jgi:redox-sensitive bicupin YhaK (pirin superfamily)
LSGTQEAARELRVVASRIELDDISGSVLFPTPAQGPWLPFVRFAVTISTGGGDDPAGHSHRGEEVMNYILEGHVGYEDDVGHDSVLERGAVVLLTAREEAHHNLMQKQGSRSRWLSVVVRCPPTMGGPAHQVHIAPGPIPALAGDVTAERRLVGPDAPVASSSGFECIDIEFRKDGLSAFPVGRERRAVAYTLEGSGLVDGQGVGAGAGALIENATEVSIRAASGTRILLASMPRKLTASGS